MVAVFLMSFELPPVPLRNYWRFLLVDANLLFVLFWVSRLMTGDVFTVVGMELEAGWLAIECLKVSTSSLRSEHC